MNSSSSMVRINWNPSPSVLRQFGWMACVVLTFLAWRWTNEPLIRLWVIGTAIALAGLGTWKPNANKPLFVGLTLLTMPIGIVVGELALLLIYFGQFFPIALVFRLVGRDALQLRIDRKRETYWSVRKPRNDSKDYFRQF